MEETAATTEVTAPAAPAAGAEPTSNGAPPTPAETHAAPEDSSMPPARPSALDSLSRTEPEQGPAEAPEQDAATEAEPALAEWAEDTLSLPEGVDADLVASFGEAAVGMGLTRTQAQKLADWQLAAVKDAYARQMERGTQELVDAWGSGVQKNCEQVVSFLARMERLTGSDSFSKALRETGAANSPAIIMGLHALSKVIAEDSIGGIQAETEGPEDALTGIERAFAGARANTERRFF